MSHIFFKDKWALGAMGTWCVLWAVSFSLAYTSLFPLSGALVIHTDFRERVDLIGGAGDIASILIALAFLGVCNSILAYLLYRRDRIVAYALLGGAVFVSLLGLILMYILVGLN